MIRGCSPAKRRYAEGSFFSMSGPYHSRHGAEKPSLLLALHLLDAMVVRVGQRVQTLPLVLRHRSLGREPPGALPELVDVPHRVRGVLRIARDGGLVEMLQEVLSIAVRRLAGDRYVRRLAPDLLQPARTVLHRERHRRRGCEDEERAERECGRERWRHEASVRSILPARREAVQASYPSGTAAPATGSSRWSMRGPPISHDVAARRPAWCIALRMPRSK